jgi:hypothetical protein
VSYVAPNKACFTISQYETIHSIQAHIILTQMNV